MGWFRTTKEQAEARFARRSASTALDLVELTAAFDRERGLLYVLQPLADEEWTIVHVWRID
jgi:hypothetical protein